MKFLTSVTPPPFPPSFLAPCFFSPKIELRARSRWREQKGESLIGDLAGWDGIRLRYLLTAGNAWCSTLFNSFPLGYPRYPKIKCKNVNNVLLGERCIIFFFLNRKNFVEFYDNVASIAFFFLSFFVHLQDYSNRVIKNWYYYRFN